MMTHACNPSYSRGAGSGLWSAQVQLERTYTENKLQRVEEMPQVIEHLSVIIKLALIELT
jgi:hypothetical protein